MKSMRLYAQGGLRRYLLVMDAGDEACAEIVAFARDRDIRGASLTAIGAASRVVLGYFDPAIDDYEFTTHDEQVELASFVGDIAWGEGGGEGEGEDGPVLHAHGVLGRKGGSALAGHFRELHVFPTMEVMLIETPAHIRKARDAETGLELISIERSDAEGERAVDPSLPGASGTSGSPFPTSMRRPRSSAPGSAARSPTTDSPATTRRGAAGRSSVSTGSSTWCVRRGCGTGTAGCCAIRRRSSCGGCWSARRKG